MEFRFNFNEIYKKFNFMSEEDLANFTKKVKALQLLIESLDQIPGRKAELASCKNHDEVVNLAKSWGFIIGNRWGESDLN